MTDSKSSSGSSSSSSTSAAAQSTPTSKPSSNTGKLKLLLSKSNKSSLQSATSGKSQDLSAAVEELRRENERMFAELSSTQDLLEHYRSLIRDHLAVCVCSSRDHYGNKWRRHESEYRKLLAFRLNDSIGALARSPFSEISLESKKFPEISLKPVKESNGKSFIQSYLDTITPVKETGNNSNLQIKKRKPVTEERDNLGKRTKILKLSTDNDVERLDQLNNALDQILLGRYDALNDIQAQISNHREYPEEDSGEEDSEEEDEEDWVVNGSQKPAESEEEENLDEEKDDDDIIFLDEVKKREETSRVSSVNNSTILSAALESGFKPYPTYQSINSTVNTTSSKLQSAMLNPGSIKLGSEPSVSTVDENQNVVNDGKSSSLMPKRPHLTNEERLDIINRLKMNESGATLAREYGITKQAVSAIKRRAQLMGDSFQSNSSQKFVASLNNNNSNSNSPSSVLQSKLVPNGQNRKPKNGSPVTINLALQSPIDNSLVTRQLKQQKFNATLVKQSNLLAAFPRAASNLVMPVNPVAIIKSQMAKQQQQLKQDAKRSTELAATKRLLLPGLLQGTESYPPVSYLKAAVTAAAAAAAAPSADKSQPINQSESGNPKIKSELEMANSTALVHTITSSSSASSISNSPEQEENNSSEIKEDEQEEGDDEESEEEDDDKEVLDNGIEESIDQFDVDKEIYSEVIPIDDEEESQEDPMETIDEFDDTGTTEQC